VAHACNLATWRLGSLNGLRAGFLGAAVLCRSGGDEAPSFVLQAKDVRIRSNDILLKYRTGNDSNIHGPIVFLAYTNRSGFIERLVSDPDCFKELLENSPDNTNYVFLFYAGSSSTVRGAARGLAQKFESTMQAYYLNRFRQDTSMASRVRRFPSWPKPVKKDFFESWISRMYFATFPVSTLGNWIPRVLSQWYCSGHGCGFNQIVIENARGGILRVSKRLDARYDWLPSPSTALAKYGHLLVLFVGDACDGNILMNVKDDYLALVSMEGAKCSYFTKVQNCEKNGARGVLVYAAPSQSLADMNCNGTECNTQLNIPASMIPHDVGIELKSSYNSYVRFQTTPSDTFVFGIDGEGKVEETGWFLYPSMLFLAYQAQWFNYKTELLKNLTTGDAIVINVFNHTVMQGEKGITATVDLPSIDDLQQYEHVELDFSLSCPGSRDDTCAHWDHVIQLYVCCNASNELCGLELGRWITPFRRRIGHWLTPVKPLIPLLQSADSSSTNKCNFTMKTVPWAMAWVPSLNIRLVNKVQVSNKYKTFHAMDKALVPFKLLPLFRGGTFDKNYNSKYSPVHFIPPRDTEKVKLVATITGHGSDNNNCAEFCVTSHHFVVNNKQNFSRVFKNAGTAMGCADRVPEGVVPNEHGTWLYGRDGWCDGQEVIPWVVDITGALSKAPNNTIDYFGWFNNTDPHPTRDPGQIIMYSYLVYYKSLKP